MQPLFHSVCDRRTKKGLHHNKGYITKRLKGIRKEEDNTHILTFSRVSTLTVPHNYSFFASQNETQGKTDYP